MFSNCCKYRAMRVLSKFIRLRSCCWFIFINLVIHMIACPSRINNTIDLVSNSNIFDKMSLFGEDESQISNRKYLNESDVDEIREEIRRINERQEISNTEKFGSFQHNTTIIIIQVHNRLLYLRPVIESLKRAMYIEESLVIFSHDHWNNSINEEIWNITEFRHMQMFYPFSIQLYPNTFPGVDPRDCKRNHVKGTNLRRKSCLNEDWPDSFGHYREAHLTQIKHHWWWKINRVFDGLNITANWSGDILFMEEDHYVTPDFLHVLRLLRNMANRRTDTHFLSVGNYLGKAGFSFMAFRYDLAGSKFNMGFAFNRTTWSIMKKNRDFFCKFDEYHWDWTLTKMVRLIRILEYSMLASRLTRMHHLGNCGIHYKGKTCDAAETIRQIQSEMKKNKQYYFPKYLMVSERSYMTREKVRDGFGGFKDFRDVQLCLAIGHNTANDETIKKLQFEKEIEWG